MDPSKEKNQSELENIVQKLAAELASKNRKLEVEAALDGVRSRSLAMHQSSELREVVSVLFDEMEKLGIPMHTVIINIFREQVKVPDIWIASPGKAYSTPYVYFEHPIHTDVFKAREQGIDILAKTYSFEEKNEYFRHIFENSDISNLSAERMKMVMDAPGYAISFAFTKNTAISIHSYTDKPFSDEHNHILKRFAFVFEQAYTRFKDLETAEKNARRAEREASLNRVRAEIAAMRSPDDLEQIIPLLWCELCSLGVSFSRCGVFIMDEEERVVHAYLSNPEDTYPALLRIPFDCSELIHQITGSWKNEKVHRDVWDRDRFTDWVHTLVEWKVITSAADYKGAAQLPDPLYLHFVPFVQGMLYVGSKQELDSRQVRLVKSLAGAFSVAYARYEDFIRLQNAKDRIESALEKLKSAQNQLIQQEKLASLGQLTAGIAHEIKNPLNFVNNFSAVSVEMIDEVMEAIAASGPGAGDGEVSEILSDIKLNLTKITDHGKRADRIVTSMLQHSRGSTRAPEPTNLNTLVKEFVNLSFHGMRAGKNPVSVDIVYELDDAAGDVPLIAEDFSRVIVNLCNNAFDAMREKLKVESLKLKVESGELEVESLKLKVERGELKGESGKAGAYLPKLTVRTERSDQGVVVEIEDNGPGIPGNIRDKILQPFFTTKKGTQGTGLGLSITHDIIKAHGGQIQLQDSLQEGALFRIILPKI